MSMSVACSVPGVAILAAERRWTSFPGLETYEGAPKLAGVRGGFVAGVGDSNSITSLLAALQALQRPVTPRDVQERARAVHALFAQPFKAQAVLSTSAGIRMVIVEQPEDSFHDGDYGFSCGLPHQFDTNVMDLVDAASADCANLHSIPEVVARIGRLFADVHDRSPFVGRILDVGLVTRRGVVFLHGDVDALADTENQPKLQAQPASYHAALSRDGRTIGVCGGLVRKVFAYRVRLPVDEPIPSDPYQYAEDNQIGMQVVEPTIENLQSVVDLTYDPPGEGDVDYIVLRPYHVTDDGQWVPGPAWNATLQPPVRMQPIVATDDHETVDTGYFFISNQYRGMPLTSVTMGRQTSPSNIVSGLTPTRGPGDTSVVKDRPLDAGEYEGEITLPIGWQSWIWFDLTFGDGYTMRVTSPPLGPNRTPAFAGLVPLVVGTTINIHGDNVRSVRVERKSGATWQVDRDTTLPIGIDVALEDDSGNPGLSSGTASYLVTIYGDPISARDGNTLTDSQSVSVMAAGGSATYSIDIMTVSAPAIGDTVGHVTYKASSSTPAIDTRRRYRVGGGPFGAWAAVAAASPDPAPTSSTQYAISGLPAARLITGQIDPPQYTVEVQLEGTLLDGTTEHDVQVRGFSYTTNADDV